MLDEPLIFVEVALLNEDPISIQAVLSSERDVLETSEASTAVFYSISNCQRGLAGVSFGNFLIKQVAKELSSQLPQLTTFRTLSPVPGLMRWIDEFSSDEQVSDDLYEHGEAFRLAQSIATGAHAAPLEDGESQKLAAMVAHFLIEESRADNQPRDPVARFHLGNGASLDQVLPEADVSEKGAKQSASVMVSYLYDLDKVISNHEAYARQRTVIRSEKVDKLLSAAKKVKKRAAG